MDQQKAESRGNRGERRKHSFRIKAHVKRLCFAEKAQTPREIGKLTNTRTVCSCVGCSPDHKDSVKYAEATEVLACNMAELSDQQQHPA